MNIMLYFTADLTTGFAHGGAATSPVDLPANPHPPPFLPPPVLIPSATFTGQRGAAGGLPPPPSVPFPGAGQGTQLDTAVLQPAAALPTALASTTPSLLVTQTAASGAVLTTGGAVNTTVPVTTVAGTTIPATTTPITPTTIPTSTMDPEALEMAQEAADLAKEQAELVAAEAAAAAA
jgi:hypothetical protein